jgi:hypothetical protein
MESDRQDLRPFLPSGCEESREIPKTLHHPVPPDFLLKRNFLQLAAGASIIQGKGCVDTRVPLIFTSTNHAMWGELKYCLMSST